MRALVEGMACCYEAKVHTHMRALLEKEEGDDEKGDSGEKRKSLKINI